MCKILEIAECAHFGVEICILKFGNYTTLFFSMLILWISKNAQKALSNFPRLSDSELLVFPCFRNTLLPCFPLSLQISSCTQFCNISKWPPPVKIKQKCWSKLHCFVSRDVLVLRILKKQKRILKVNGKLYLIPCLESTVKFRIISNRKSFPNIREVEVTFLTWLEVWFEVFKMMAFRLECFFKILMAAWNTNYQMLSFNLQIPTIFGM